MEERRKIIIPTGNDPEETLATPHFDAEATLSARPVVPISEPLETPRQNPYGASSAPGVLGPRVASSSSSWKRSTLFFIVLAAVSVGVASGLAIGLYQTRRRAPAPMTTETSASSIQQATTQTRPPEPDTQAAPPLAKQEAKEPEAVKQPEAETEIPVSPTDKTDKEAKVRSAGEDKRSASEDKKDAPDNEKQTARENRRRDEERTQQATERDNRATEREPASDERDETRDDIRARREERRAQRREERRRQREEDDDRSVDVPRTVERAQQQINRIRDIFEGRQP